MIDNDAQIKPIKHLAAAEKVLCCQELRERLLTLSQRFTTIKGNKIQTRRTETSRLVHGPAWRAYIIEATVGENAQVGDADIHSLFEQMTEALLLAVFVRVARLLNEEKRVG